MNAPTLTGTAGDSFNGLTWSAVTGAVKYRLRRAVGSAGYGTRYTGPATSYGEPGLTNGTVYHYRVRGVDAKGKSGPWSNVVDLTPAAVVVPPPPSSSIVGYGKDTVGGQGGRVYDVTDFAGYRAALEASGPRIVKLHGSAVFDGRGASFSVTNGFLTQDGSDYTGPGLKDYSIVYRASQLIFREMALRPGEGSSAGASADRRAVTFNPPSGGTISHIVLDHCSIAWGPDVVLSLLNNTFDVTVQYCMLGPALYESNIASSPNGYGPNITQTTGGYCRRITYYRNLIPMFDKRGIRGHDVDGFDAVNNVVYDWGTKSGHGNPRGANIMNNIFKKGPETTNSEGWDSEIAGASPSYFTNSVYFNGNIGRTASGAPFTLTESYGSGVKRSTPYGTLSVPAAPADDALFAAVVNGAGRTHQDAIDTLVKQHALAGTSAGYYNGASGPAPHPSW